MLFFSWFFPSNKSTKKIIPQKALTMQNEQIQKKKKRRRMNWIRYVKWRDRETAILLFTYILW